MASTFSLCLVASLLQHATLETPQPNGTVKFEHVTIVNKCPKTEPVDGDKVVIFQQRYGKAK